MKARYLILDCYVDEPACLGVPPFISPYPRYVFGALVDAGIDPDSIDYLTIDSIRPTEYLLPDQYAMAFVIGGAVVPGKYLGYRIGTVHEISAILERNTRQHFALGGPVGKMIAGSARHNAVIINCDIEKYAHGFPQGSPFDTTRSPDETARWALRGAEVVMRHPEYPELICEIESYRGCPRTSRCSFCSELLHEGTEFRDNEDIIAEVDALIGVGISRFRIGSQPDILQYGSPLAEYCNGFPRPEPARVVSLFRELGSRRTAGRITLLNVDNANPGTVVNFPDESEEILDAIARAVTPGDTLALGVESFDPTVIAGNNLKITRDEIIPVIDMINRIGGVRVEGIPMILPGINLIHGLPGETDETFRQNFDALLRIRDAGLLVKRINIRALNPFPGTPAATGVGKISTRVRNRYEYYRDRIRAEIDHVMLKSIYPPGTILREVRIEEARDGYSYGRQIASYAITARIPVELKQKVFYDVAVTGHRERSVIALPVPIVLNALPQSALKIIPGVGAKGSEKLILHRPFGSKEEFTRMFPAVSDALIALMVF